MKVTDFIKNFREDFKQIANLGVSAKLTISYDKPIHTVGMSAKFYEELRAKRSKKMFRKIYLRTHKNSFEIVAILRTNRV